MRVRLTVCEVPGYFIEASLAVVWTSTDKEGDSYAGTVGYIYIFDFCVVHVSPFRDSCVSDTLTLNYCFICKAEK